MSDVIISQRWLARGGTATDLAAVNEKPKARELILETDTGRMKRGDGSTAYNDLPYINTGKIDFTGIDDGKVPVWDAENSKFIMGDGGSLLSIVAGSHVSVDTTDPKNPVVSVTGISTAGYDEGSNFPGSPGLNDKFYRTDLNLLCYYDGTRWLTVQEFEVAGGTQNAVYPQSSSGTYTRWPVRSDFDIYVTGVKATSAVSGTNNGSNYWSVDVQKAAPNDSRTSMGSFNTSSGGPDTYTNHDITINSVVSASAHPSITAALTRTGSAGPIRMPINLCYRLVVT